MTGYSFSKVFNPKPGWYCGDFHVHTNASMDGEHSPTMVAQLAKTEGLDFVTFSDHNSIEGFLELNENINYPVIPGIEVTLDKGHFNVFGMGDRRQWMEGIYGNQKAVPLPSRYKKVKEMMHQIGQEDFINSINHPLLHPWEWRFTDTDLRYVHCVELWNDLYWPDNADANPKTVDLWTDWLNAGHRVVAIGGSDYHYPPKPEKGLPGERLGQPTTYVYAEALAGPAILDGIRLGRAYVSSGPQIDFRATTASNTYMIGDDLSELSSEIEFTVTVANQPKTVRIQLIKNGRIIAEGIQNGEEPSVQFHDSANPTSPAWYRIEVLDQKGQALVITNPIYVNTHKRDVS
jgi:hypothetical protein